MKLDIILFSTMPIPKTFLTSVETLTINWEDNLAKILGIESSLFPTINMSSKYTKMSVISLLSLQSSRDGSTHETSKSLLVRKYSSKLFHRRSSCFKPYSSLCRKYTQSCLPGIIKPGGWDKYNFSSIFAFRN